MTQKALYELCGRIDPMVYLHISMLSVFLVSGEWTLYYRVWLLRALKKAMW